MKKITLKYLLIMLAGLSAKAQPGPYNLASVPESVKNKASIIVHLDNTEVEVESIDKATLTVHRIFTVLNDDGKYALLFNEYSSKYVSLDDAEIKVYDANGKQTGKYKKKEMRTEAVGEGLIEDGYVTYYRISTQAYPITVDIKYEKKFKSTLFFPGYWLISEKEGVVESSYTLRTPTGISLRYKAKNTSIEPVVTEDGKYKIYKWAARNLAPIEYEEGATGGGDRYPHVTVVSDRFSLYGFDGDLSSWKSFGTWLKDLFQGLDILSPERQQFFSALTKNAAGEKEKIKLIYNYMQENFRYVSIQLGIGGFRPFSAEFTDKKKYGDCKALSNYMKAALKTVGIKSYVAIINSAYNQEPVDPDFPSYDFNHAILCVPGQKDSVWLECTSSTAEFGELGTSTENRNALLITEDGGVLVPTPKSHAGTNILSSVTTVKVDDDLSALTETLFTTKGVFTELMNDILKDSRDHQKEALVFYFGFKQPDDFILAKDELPGEHRTKLRMAVAKVQEFNAGSKLFISPRMYKIWPRSLPKAENRKSDFYFRYPFEKNDTTIFKLPANMKPDVLPKENELACDYAIYRSKYWYKETENSIYSATTLVLKQHKVPAADYPRVKKFFDDIAQDDTQKIVVQKGATEKKAF